MATLTEAANFSKNASRRIIYATGGLILLFVLFLVVRALVATILPEKAAGATVAFGKLPKYDLSEGIKPPAGITYSLQTISGSLPQLPSMAKVFAIEQPQPLFGDVERFIRRAATIDFSADPEEISPGKLRFIDQEQTGRILTMDTINGNINFTSDYLSDPKIAQTRPETIEEAQETARNFFRALEVNLEDFGPEQVNIKKMRIDAGTLVETPALAGTNLVLVNFVRDDLDGLDVIWPRADKVSVWALVSGTEVVEAASSMARVLGYKFATYPLKSPALAFEELEAGRVALTKRVELSGLNQSTPPDSYDEIFSEDQSLSETSLKSEVIILDVKLGYVESQKNNQYLQPVYMFLATGGLIAYVPAVDEAWVDETSAPIPPVPPFP